MDSVSLTVWVTWVSRWSVAAATGRTAVVSTARLSSRLVSFFMVDSSFF